MFHVTDEPLEFELPGDDPKTVVVYRQFTQEDELVLAGIFAEIGRAESALGREPTDAQSMRRKAHSQRARMVDRIVMVRNLREPGDEVADKAEIERFLADLPVSWFEALNVSMRTALGLFAGKA